MAVTKVWIEDGCTACGLCQEVCPAVFGENDEGEAFVKDNAEIAANEACIREAAGDCPVEVIKYE